MLGGDQAALVKFCTARNALTALDEATAVERRRHTQRVGVYRDLLREQMVAANTTCLPVMSDGKEKYAVLRPSVPRSQQPITVESVMRHLRGLTYEMLPAGSKTLEEGIEAALRLAMAGNGTADGGVAAPSGGAAAPSGGAPSVDPPQRPPKLSIVTKRPEDAKPVHPASLASMRETVEGLVAATEAAKTLRSRDEPRRRELRAAAKETEEAVAIHLASHDPEHGTRRVRLVQPGSKAPEATYYLRRRSAVRTTRPTLRTALPAIRQTIRSLREEAGVDATSSWATLRWLQAPATLAKVERLVTDSLARLHEQKQGVKVVLTNVS